MCSEDDKLVVRAKQGDSDAFCQLFEQHRAPLTRYCRLFVQDEAEDVVQNTFFRASGGIKKLRGDTAAAFKAWLYQIARNLCLDVLEKRTKETIVPIPSPNLTRLGSVN